ncbi:hypothetical protein KSP39_PZI002178 [Platanthera zijinensis]|uniref:Uncharacterized protein n=1 Tax=Platanthera zijinensis TaxID=2320716 RepID=A0AAP0GDS7_9ASPA
MAYIAPSLSTLEHAHILSTYLMPHHTLDEFWDTPPADPPDEFFTVGDTHHIIEPRLLVGVHDFHSGGCLIRDVLSYIPPGEPPDVSRSLREIWLFMSLPLSVDVSHVHLSTRHICDEFFYTPLREPPDRPPPVIDFQSRSENFSPNPSFPPPILLPAAWICHKTSDPFIPRPDLSIRGRIYPIPVRFHHPPSRTAISILSTPPVPPRIVVHAFSAPDSSVPWSAHYLLAPAGKWLCPKCCNKNVDKSLSSTETALRGTTTKTTNKTITGHSLFCIDKISHSGGSFQGKSESAAKKKAGFVKKSSDSLHLCISAIARSSLSGNNVLKNGLSTIGVCKMKKQAVSPPLTKKSVHKTVQSLVKLLNPHPRDKSTKKKPDLSKNEAQGKMFGIPLVITSQSSKKSRKKIDMTDKAHRGAKGPWSLGARRRGALEAREAQKLGKKEIERIGRPIR